MPSPPDRKNALEEARQRLLKATEKLELQSRGLPLIDAHPIGSYAEDFPELLEELLNNPDLDPMSDPWWGKEE